MDRLHPFETKTLGYIRERGLIDRGEGVLVAFSGGADSTALLNVVNKLRSFLGIRSLVTAHFDHGLRGSESHRDLLWTEQRAKEMGLAFFPGRGDVLGWARRHRVSVEMAARELRGRFLARVLRERSLNKIALGHTADDQVEEMILRFFRGTGPTGMSGMKPLSGGGIVRPILWAGRGDVLDYCRAEGLHYVKDSSNDDLRIARNFIRREILSMIDSFLSRNVSKAILRHAELMAEEESFWEDHLKGVWDEVVYDESSREIRGSVSAFSALHPAVRRRLLRGFVAKTAGSSHRLFAVHVDAAIRFIHDARSGGIYRLPQGLILRKENQHFIITMDAGQEQPSWRPCRFNECGTYDLVGLEVSLMEVDPSKVRLEESDPYTACLDVQCIDWPLEIRNWRPGDRFQPLGLRGTKKLQDFFTDCKVPRSTRHGIPILCDRKKICWVVGLRLDNRVRVTKRTRRVLQICVKVK